jgi:uncharacterized protein (UPF0212 family)
MNKFLIRKKARIYEESVSSASKFTLHVSENDAMNISVSNDTRLLNQRQTKCVIVNTGNEKVPVQQLLININTLIPC